MQQATLNLSIQPRRILKKAEAAKYCGLSVSRFTASCPVGPVQLGESEIGFDIHDLDKWIERLKGPNAELDVDDIVDGLA